MQRDGANTGEVPRVSVVMAAYNTAKYLPEALDSILTQTMPHFELLVFDDCSTDATGEVLDAYAARDPRVRVIHNERNLRQLPNLNRGIKMARAPYVAIMDSDDVALPERLQKQADYLDTHPEVGVVGSLFEVIDEAERWVRPAYGARVDGTWLDGSIVMCHSTMMVRASVYEQCGMYDPDYDDSAGDYELQSRFGYHGVRHHVIDESLLQYRVHPTSLTGTRRKQQVATILKVTLRTLFRYRRALTRRGWTTLARYVAIWLYLVLGLERIVPRSVGKRLWPSPGQEGQPGPAATAPAPERRREG
jgi:glycosyltransferase involved in cell wall biosynthesis